MTASMTVLSSSYAVTASFALNAGAAVDAFPFTGSAAISGSLTVSGSIRQFVASGSKTTTITAVTNSFVGNTQITGSGNGNNAFRVSGSGDFKGSLTVSKDLTLGTQSTNISTFTLSSATGSYVNVFTVGTQPTASFSLAALNSVGNSGSNLVIDSTYANLKFYDYDRTAATNNSFLIIDSYDAGSPSTPTFTRGLVVTGSLSAHSISSSFSGSGAQIFGVVSASYAYTASSAIISLSSSYSDNSNTANSATSATSASYAYTASSAISAGTASYAKNFIISGSQVITGSLVGLPISQSVSSLTASLNLQAGNFFNLTFPASANTYVTASNQVPGQTVNIKVTQGATTGSLSFGAGFKQVSGSFYTGSSTANAVDIVTLISFDSTGLYVSNVNNLI
jgi:hypothetical protein